MSAETRYIPVTQPIRDSLGDIANEIRLDAAVQQRNRNDGTALGMEQDADLIDSLCAAFDAAPVPVTRRRCTTHDAEWYTEAPGPGGHGSFDYCWKAYVAFGQPADYGDPCRFVSEVVIPTTQENT